MVALYRSLLGARARRDDELRRPGRDSLSYVEVSLRLEALLQDLPDGWHLLPPGELATSGSTGRPPGRRLHTVDTTVLVRAVAILLILANHTHLSFVPGGAHTLLALVGYNLARFQLTSRPRGERVRGIARSVSRIVLPSAAWIGVVALVAGTYDWRNVLMLNQVLGDWSQWSDHWHYWFIEAVTSLLLGTALLMAVPAVDRWERRWPFAFPIALVGARAPDEVCRAGARCRTVPGRERLRARLAVRDRLGCGARLDDLAARPRVRHPGAHRAGLLAEHARP